MPSIRTPSPHISAGYTPDSLAFAIPQTPQTHFHQGAVSVFTQTLLPSCLVPSHHSGLSSVTSSERPSLTSLLKVGFSTHSLPSCPLSFSSQDLTPAELSLVYLQTVYSRQNVSSLTTGTLSFLFNNVSLQSSTMPTIHKH